MAKPIFLVGFPISAESSAVWLAQSELFSKLGEDYHVITYKISGIEEIRFEVLNAVSATDVEIEEIIQKTNYYIEQVLREAGTAL